MNRKQRRAQEKEKEKGRLLKVTLDWNVLVAEQVLPDIYALLADHPEEQALQWAADTLKSLVADGGPKTYRRIAEEKGLTWNESISKCEGYFYCYMRLRGIPDDEAMKHVKSVRDGASPHVIIASLGITPGGK